MLKKVRNFINTRFSNVMRETLLDWPLDYGVETAVMNNVRGDYHEFGVYKGRSFSRCASKFMKLLDSKEANEMRFWAYDSFEGLPSTNDNYAPPHFTEGAYSASEQMFLNNVTKAGVDQKQIETVPGFYNESLTKELADRVFADRKISMVYIDCDIYESTVPVFDYITAGLQVGSVIVIDDWVRHHMHPNHGVQRAYFEWLEKNPQIKTCQLALTKRIAFVVYEV